MYTPTSNTRDTLVFVLAGGRGERLFPLTRDRAKGAVPFAGQFRLIDFTLANCARAELSQIYVLTQYKSASLERHLHHSWNFPPHGSDEPLRILHPRHPKASGNYQGTADAVRHNLHILSQERPSQVLILSSDHLYDMDYIRFLDYHRDSGAQMTIASMRVSPTEAYRFGIMQANADGRISSFTEKPVFPPRFGSDNALASMGIYVFDTDVLVGALQDGHARDQDRHDFGRDIIPHLLDSGCHINSYDVCAGEQVDSFYWKDIGTLDAYWDASMELLARATPFDFHHPSAKNAWPFPRPIQIRELEANTWVCPGATIDRAQVRRSILSPGVRVGRGAEIVDSILMDGVQIGAGARIYRAIIDKNVHIPDHYSLESDCHRHDFHCTPHGIVVLPKNIDLVRWQHDAQYAHDYFGNGAPVRPFAPPASWPVRALGRFQVLPPPPELDEAAYRLVRSITHKEIMGKTAPKLPATLQYLPH